MRVCVTGAGGFIGGHLVRRLVADGHRVTAVDIKPHKDWWQVVPGAHCCFNFDLRQEKFAEAVLGGGGNFDLLYHLAADMGGRGFIDTHESECAVNALLDLQVLRFAALCNVPKMFYASTACIYPIDHQCEGSGLLPESLALAPYDPDGMYGLAKLFGERAASAFARDHHIDIRIGRFHGVYGSNGSWDDGREKAPAALCRKIAEAAYWRRFGQIRPIQIWGDGTATRSFMHVDDAVEGMLRIMDSEINFGPLNLGSDTAVTIDTMAEIIGEVAGLDRLELVHIPGAVGVQRRNSHNGRIRACLDWAPSIPLRQGLTKTYPWVAAQVEDRFAAATDQAQEA